MGGASAEKTPGDGDQGLHQRGDPQNAWFIAENPIKLLVGGLEHFLFFHILGIIIPID